MITVESRTRCRRLRLETVMGEKKYVHETPHPLLFLFDPNAQHCG